MYILGQSFGVLAAIIAVFRPQFRRKKHILLGILLGNLCCTMNYILIGKTGAAPLVCMVAVLQSALALMHERKNSTVSAFERALFFILYLGMGLLGFFIAEGVEPILTREKIVELLPIIGALMLMLSTFAKGEQRTRFFLLLNGSIWLTYSAIIGAATIFSNIVSVCSTGCALWKYRNKRPEQNNSD